MDKLCVCGGDLIAWEGWHVCVACGGAMTHSGKYQPAHAGWGVPKLPLAAQRACTCERDLAPGGCGALGVHHGWCQALRASDAYLHLRGAP